VSARADVRAAFRNTALVLGATGIALIALVALFGDRIAPYDPQAWRLVEFYDDRIIVPPSAPDSHHLLGTDPLGRDQLSRLLWGARLTLGVTLLAVVLRLALSLFVAAIATLARGAGDRALATLTNVVSGYPQLLLALLVGVALRDLGVFGFVIALGVVGWPELARFIQFELRRIARAPHVEAARAMGASPPRLALSHIARNALPQIVGVTALETASVLLLLAELGFVGLFVAGSTGFTSDSGAPVLPVRDRAPEWGQMLAGAHGYATNHEWVAYVPAIVVVAAVFAFNLFGEGVRATLDPHSGSVLSPRALGWAARGLSVFVLVGAGGFTLSSLTSARGMSYEDGLARARAAAERERPGSVLVASVLRFTSEAHSLDRPQKLNYYFVDPEGLTLRVGYIDGDPNAAEVTRFSDEDDLGEVHRLAPVDAAVAPWQDALGAAERAGGTAYRSSTRAWLTRVVLLQSGTGPRYRVRYGPIFGPANVDVAIDARTGNLVPLAERIGDNLRTVERELGATPVLLRVSASWRPTSGSNIGFGADAPVLAFYDFGRGDGTGRVLRVSLTLTGGAQVFDFPGQRSPPLGNASDPQVLFARVEDAGGRALRAEWDRASAGLWSASGTLELIDGRQRFSVFYQALTGTNRFAEFRLDVATGAVQRLS
jgi:peptide/nickel transport system permease protein